MTGQPHPAIVRTMSARAPALDTTAWVLLVLLSIVWGASFFLAEVALAELLPVTIVAARMVFGAAGLWVLVLITRPALPRARAAPRRPRRGFGGPHVPRTPRALPGDPMTRLAGALASALLILAALAPVSCAATPGALVPITVQARGTPEATDFVTVAGWTVSLDEAWVAIAAYRAYAEEDVLGALLRPGVARAHGGIDPDNGRLLAIRRAMEH